MSGIYIHIPFCKQACSYCDFYFVTKPDRKSDFVDALVSEIEGKKNTAYSQETVETIYFGGGTPSLLSISEFERILSTLKDTFHLDLKEITVELNPDDVTKEYLSGLRTLGVNRVSMGVQTFDEDLLRFMNRTHNAREALECLEILRASEINVFTADLIYGNPGQTLEMLQHDLDTLLTFDPQHVSAYSLTIEPKTRLGKQVQLGRLLPAEDDLVEQHFELVEKTLLQHGIKRYEVSNFAKPGSEAFHNSNYWEHKNYLGLGPGAHSFWWKEGDEHATRWENEADLQAYINQDKDSTSDLETLDLHALAEERLMLALRTRKGISTEELRSRYDYEFSDEQLAYLNQKVDEGKLEHDGVLRLTSDGLKIADAITLDILTVS
jgi:oxygen-independent coproporphyrinogen-3 oxidase